jgi:hypothetical protein
VTGVVSFLIAIVLAVWTFRDAKRRQTQTAPFLWSLGVLFFSAIFFPLYLAKRPLRDGEVRKGGLGWNFLKNFAIYFTAIMPLATVAVAFESVAEEATTSEGAVAWVVSTVVMGTIMWVVVAGIALVLGLILKNDAIIERGPTGSLAQVSGWPSTALRSIERRQTSTHSYGDNAPSLGNEEHGGFSSELASVKEIVDLSPQQALDEAQTFLVREGYRPLERRGESLTVQRRSPNQIAGQNTLDLTVTALHQPEGGVRISVRGNDREGVQERQAAWLEWSEKLPKKQEETPPKDQQGERHGGDYDRPW